MEVKKTAKTLSNLMLRLVEGKRFAFVRWGDGRLLMLDPSFPGEPGDHTNNALIHELLHKAAKERDPDWLVGMMAGYPQEPHMRPGTFGLSKRDANLQEIVRNNFPPQDFESAVPFHYMALFDPESVLVFMAALRRRKVLIVGGKHLEAVAPLFRADFLAVPASEAFKERSRIEKKIATSEADTILFSAGAFSIVMQHRLFIEGRNIITIDTGSFLDLCAGLATRQFITDNAAECSRFYQLVHERYGKK